MATTKNGELMHGIVLGGGWGTRLTDTGVLRFIRTLQHAEQRAALRGVPDASARDSARRRLR